MIQFIYKSHLSAVQMPVGNADEKWFNSIPSRCPVIFNILIWKVMKSGWAQPPDLCRATGPSALV